MAQSKLATEVLISVGTVPLLLAILGTKACATWIQNLGQSSEEIFRGDRLPLLKMPPSEE
ncbi:MAG: hypothetical protein MUF49_30935 [Oculatellaceae cyanobacterium Prado106]|nr:hypothetical protein [Oculatellaceae cyanobacterium Prado106]